jgi:hypothetical protein
MKKVAWSDTSPDQSDTVWQSSPVSHSTTAHQPNAGRHANTVWQVGREPGGLDAARGLIIGLAISQVFWLVLALCVLKFWTHRP